MKRTLSIIATTIILISALIIPCAYTSDAKDQDTTPETLETIELNTPIIGIKIPEEEHTTPSLNIPLSKELQEYAYMQCGYDNELFFLVMAVMQAESGFDSGSTGIDGHDKGLMQIRDCNLEHLEQKFGKVDLMNPRDNIRCGVYIIKELLDEYKYKNLALMAYNCGEAGAKRLWQKGIYSTNYSRKVTGYYKVFSEGAAS